MAKIIESRFRVLDIFQEDVFLSDLETGPPVHVEIDDESYNENLRDKIANLEEGNLIEAEIRSESVAREDGLWFFLSLEMIERTRFYFIDEASTHPNVVEKFKRHINNIGNNAARKLFKSDGEPIGYLTVVEAPTSEAWTGLQAGTRSHEKDLNHLSNLGDPPHEVIYTRSPDENYLIFYHFIERETKLAQNIIKSNS